MAIRQVGRSWCDMSSARMRGTTIVLLGAAGVAVLVATYYLGDRPRHSPLIWLTCPDDTKYSRGYAESKFEQVRLGMTQEEVLSLLGPPLLVDEYSRDGVHIRTHEGDFAVPPVGVDAVYAYSDRGNKFDCYFVRNVKFSSQGRVMDYFSGFHWD